MYLSEVGNGDGIIIGATMTEHIRGNLCLLKNGPLSKEALKMAARIWNVFATLFDEQS